MSFLGGVALGVVIGVVAGYLALAYYFHKGSWGG